MNRPHLYILSTPCENDFSWLLFFTLSMSSITLGFPSQPFYSHVLLGLIHIRGINSQLWAANLHIPGHSVSNLGYNCLTTSYLSLHSSTPSQCASYNPFWPVLWPHLPWFGPPVCAQKILPITQASDFAIISDSSFSIVPHIRSGTKRMAQVAQHCGVSQARMCFRLNGRLFKNVDVWVPSQIFCFKSVVGSRPWQFLQAPQGMLAWSQGWNPPGVEDCGLWSQIHLCGCLTCVSPRASTVHRIPTSASKAYCVD